jgi:diguanylate cyclase (GGDEF)-like protein/PAS domain S-box-containing protein
VTELKRAELELRQRESPYHAVVTAIDQGVVCQSATGEITVANPTAERITGRSERDMRGRTFADPSWQAVREDGTPFLGHEHPSMVTLRTGIAQSNVVMGIRGPDGTQRWLSINSQLLSSEALPQAVVSTFHDITEQRTRKLRSEYTIIVELGGDVAYGIRTLRMRLDHRAVAEQLAFLAHHDPLTKLPNRRLLRERFERVAANADRAGDRVAVLFLDLDNFKEINDGLGHDVGDELLVRTAERLEKNVRLTDTVGREGGDEFAVLLAGIPDVHAIARIAQTLLGAIAEPFCLDLNALTMSLSIGISVYPDDGRDFDTLRNRADAALYYAKESGRNVYRFFSAQMSADSVARTEMQLQLREALKRREFFLSYQPQFCLRDGRITALEALLRWQRSDLDTILPDTFIPNAERSGLIIPIGDWARCSACPSAPPTSPGSSLRSQSADDIPGGPFQSRACI